jgi:PhzF family phenazine biosynthesis protein
VVPDAIGPDTVAFAFVDVTAAGREVDGAGHNALGAWLWLAHAGLVGAGTFQQEIAGSALRVKVTTAAGAPTRAAMHQAPPRFGQVVRDRAALAAALGLVERDLVADRAAQVVATGAGHLLVPVADRTRVDQVRADATALAALLHEAGGAGCYVYTTAPGDPADGAHAYARFVNPTMGIVEDPATGTAAGPLAAALTRWGDVAAGAPVVVAQGHATGRPSRLRVDVDGDRVVLSGSGLVVGE